MEVHHKRKDVEIDLEDAIQKHSADKSIVYKEIDGEAIYLGYFFPKNYDRTRKYPAFVFIHGGGWNSHKIFDDQPHWQGDYLGYLARYYADKGFVSVSIDYRLVGKHENGNESGVFDCYTDCCDAIDYVIAYAEEYAVDKNRMYLLGESAGGHLAAAVLTLDQNKRYPFQKAFLINSIVNMMEDKWIEYAPEENRQNEARRLSPLYQANENMCDVILIHGCADECVSSEQSSQFYQRMRELCKPCDLHWIEGTNHAFLLAEYTQEQKACRTGIWIIDQYFKEELL